MKENIDTIFWENMGKLEGKNGIDILPNDKPDVISRLIKAIKDKDRLPDDLGDPEYEDQSEGVNEFATTIYELFCEGASIAAEMMVGKDVERAYENIMDGSGNTRDPYDETGHSRADF